MIEAWEGQGCKTSPQLTRVTRELFFAVSSRNIQLSLQYVESLRNKAGASSRRLSRSVSKLSDDAIVMVGQAFGGKTGHFFDLMALDSNAMRGKDGLPLPHFSPFPSPCSKGVNIFCQDLRSARHMSNPYFPPFGLNGPVLRFLAPFKVPL